jgi:hypothetical protein
MTNGQLAAAPQFFLPDISPEKFDEALADFAKFAGTGVPALDQRIYSVVFTSNGEEWTATVGEQLRGVKTTTQGRGRDKRERQAAVYNESTVLAIFPGEPYLVVHNSASRAWNNPISAGGIRKVVPFAAP